MPRVATKGFFVGALLVAAAACSYACVRPTNFAGFDEWLFLWLAARGVLDSPYSNRPLNFLWTIPGVWVQPHGFLGFHLVHGAYLALTGLAVRAIVLRLSPGQGRLATVAGVVAATLAPADMARLSSVQMTVNSGSTFGTCFALLGLVEASRRRSPILLLLATALGFATARSYEPTLGVLLAGPLLLLAQGGAARKLPSWIVLGWWLGLGAAAALALFPHLAGSAWLYQTGMWGIDLRPAGVLPRVLRQYVWHLRPVIQPMPADLQATTAVGAALLATLATALAGGAAPPSHLEPREDPAPGPTRARLILLGLVLSLAAYLPFALSPGMDQPHRAQMSAAPWIGLALGGLVEGLASYAPARARTALVALAAGWLVLVGSGRTAMLQREWDAQSLYAAQRRSLEDLVELAPALKPHTLVIALPEGRVWPSVFGFRHAVQYLYRDEATGYVAGGIELMYPTRKEAEGVRTETWPVVRGPWGVPPTLHRYEELVLVRVARDGALSLLQEWPAAPLGPLPPGARYAPDARILPSAGPLPERAALRAPWAGAP